MLLIPYNIFMQPVSFLILLHSCSCTHTHTPAETNDIAVSAFLRRTTIMINNLLQSCYPTPLPVKKRNSNQNNDQQFTTILLPNPVTCEKTKFEPKMTTNPKITQQAQISHHTNKMHKKNTHLQHPPAGRQAKRQAKRQATTNSNPYQTLTKP